MALPDRQTGKEYDIRFEYTDELGNYYESRTVADQFMEVGILVELGVCFNNFLRQVSFPRENTYLFMRDITDEEYDFLEGALAEYRREKHIEV